MTRKKAEILELRTRLSHSMAWFRILQVTYMPVIAHLLTSCPPSSALKQSEVATLYLPSELSAIQLSQCMPGLRELEKQLHEAQCSSSLKPLRNQLFIKTRFLIHKGLHLCHQAATTQAHALLDRNEHKIRLHAAKYWDARAALLRYQGDDELSFEWEELKQEDIQCMEDPNALEKHAMKASKPMLGESRCKLSWIWMAAKEPKAMLECTMVQSITLSFRYYAKLVGFISCSC